MTAPPMPTGAPTALARYDAMCHAIDECFRVDEVKSIRDKALAFEHYARQAKNGEAERLACCVRLRAERKAGQLLKKMEKAKGTAGAGRPNLGGRPTRPPKSETPTLADLGVSRDQSAKWQKLAEVPAAQFEEALANAKPSTAAIIAGPKPASGRTLQIPPLPDPQGLWVYGKLRDWEDDGILARPAILMLRDMDPELLADIARLAPMVADWLDDLGRCAAPPSGKRSKP